MLEKELEIQRSLVMECDGEIELLSEEKNSLSEQKYSIIMLPSITVCTTTAVNLAQKETRICQLEDKCEELRHLDDVEVKLQKREEEIKK